MTEGRENVEEGREKEGGERQKDGRRGGGARGGPSHMGGVCVENRIGGEMKKMIWRLRLGDGRS